MYARTRGQVVDEHAGRGIHDAEDRIRAVSCCGVVPGLSPALYQNPSPPAVSSFDGSDQLPVKRIDDMEPILSNTPRVTQLFESVNLSNSRCTDSVVLGPDPFHFPQT